MTQLRVTFLGTAAAAPQPDRNTSAIHLAYGGDSLLFDVGAGTAQQLQRSNTGVAPDAIFLTHLHGDHVLGLPMLLRTLDLYGREDDLVIYTPPATKDRVEALIAPVADDPGFPIAVQEVAPGTIAHKTPDYRVWVFETDHRTTSHGYVFEEADQPGRLDAERAEALGVPPGPLFGDLKDGVSVKLADGTVVHPEEVVGPPRDGRTVVYTGDTRPTGATADAAAGADLLIHEATYRDDHAELSDRNAHSTAIEAGEVAAAAGADRLALTHFSPRYPDVSALGTEAETVFDGEVIVAEDGQHVDIPLGE